ncbi:MAG: polysaccharide deacetylase family protein [Acidimicrobiales bacterium]
MSTRPWRSALSRSVKVAAAGADSLQRRDPGVVVLIYHRVGARSGLEIDLPTSLFEEQMALLAGSHHVVSLDAGIAALARPASSAGGPLVVVTFDDGTTDFVDVAMPVLERHRIPATLYVATDFIEQRRSFPHGGTPVSWSGLADACATGLIDVGSHTHGHRLLDRLPIGEVHDELERSIGLIGDRLGRRADHFAYPKAVPGSPDADLAVRLRFRSAALAGTRTNPFGHTDPHRLARSPIQTGDGTRWFARKVAGGLGLEDRLRAVLNGRRYAAATA